MKMDKHRLLFSSMFVVNFLFPRLIGMVPLTYDRQAVRANLSRFWYIYCLLFGSFYILFYPFTLFDLMFVDDRFNDGGKSILKVTRMLHHLTKYILTIVIYLRQIFYSQEMMEYINAGVKVYRRIQPVAPGVLGLRKHVLPFFFRAIFSSLGCTIKSVVKFKFLKNSPIGADWFKALYFLPDLVITSMSVRFHSTLVVQNICYRRLNSAFKECVEEINQMRNQSPSYRMRVFCEICDRFDYLAVLYDELYRFTKATERMMSMIILMNIANAFMNLTMAFLYVFMIVSEGGAPNVPSMFVMLFHSSLYVVDLIFTFIPCNYLKREMQRTGLVIHNVYIIGIDERLKKSIEQFSILLLHQKHEFSAKGLFVIDNAQFYSVIMGVASCLVIFIQFRLNEK